MNTHVLAEQPAPIDTMSTQQTEVIAQTERTHNETMKALQTE